MIEEKGTLVGQDIFGGIGKMIHIVPTISVCGYFGLGMVKKLNKMI
jgi:hypothetical protein